MSEKRYVVRKDDDSQEPRYYVGSGYNQGKAVPYFYAGLTRKSTKLYKTNKGAQEGADRFGGRVGVVELPDGSGDPVWLGYVIKTEDSLAKERETAGAGKRSAAKVDPYLDQLGQEGKSDNVDAFDGKAERAGEGSAAAGAPEGWRERQARIRREIAERRQRRREQRKLADGSARDAATAKVAANAAGEQADGQERDWIAGQVGIEDALEEAGMADAADVMGAEE